MKKNLSVTKMGHSDKTCETCHKPHRADKPRREEQHERKKPKREKERKRISSKKGSIRVVHNIAGASNVDVYIDSQKVLSNMAYKHVSGYLTLDRGIYQIKVTSFKFRKTLLRGTLKVRGGTFNTAIAVGSASDSRSLKLLAVRDDSGCPMSGKARLRFVHGAAEAPAVRVIVDGERMLEAVNFGDVSEYLNLEAPETYNVEIERENDNVEILQVMLTVEDKQNLTVITSGIPGDTSAAFTAIPLIDNEGMCISIFQ